MTHTLSFRDVEKLSAYLDGQLKPSEIARLEARLQSEPELASVLKDLRQARSVLRQLPQRRAPRNFTLTPKMVGLKPPLPRTYPVFRLATVLATLLLFFTFATNFMAPRLVRTTVPYGIGGYGGGGGGDAEPELAMEAAPEAPAEPALEAPAAEEQAIEEPSAPQAAAQAPTEIAPSAEDNARYEPTVEPSEKSGVQESPSAETFAQEAPLDEAPSAQPIGTTPQILLAVIAILSAVIALTLRYTAIRKWRAKAK
jgi:anti-sigma factor RsiW